MNEKEWRFAFWSAPWVDDTDRALTYEEKLTIPGWALSALYHTNPTPKPPNPQEQ